jgi:hypothetical protein
MRVLPRFTAHLSQSGGAAMSKQPQRVQNIQSEFSDALKHTKLSPLARVLLWTHNTIIFSRFYTFLNAEFKFVPQPVGQMVRNVSPLVSQFEVRERLAEQKFLEDKNQ